MAKEDNVHESFDVGDQIPADDDRFQEAFRKFCVHPRHDFTVSVEADENEYVSKAGSHHCDIYRGDNGDSKINIGKSELYGSFWRPENGRVKVNIGPEEIDTIDIDNGIMTIEKVNGKTVTFKDSKEY